ncbi:MAG: hypothetical protein ABSE80_14870, partial [Halobacteriota archaeon]|jgi:hypothetical protein
MAKMVFSIIKEPRTGYMSHHPGSSEHCFNCTAFRKEESGCAGEKMKELSKLPRLPNGDVKVHPVAYCNFFSPIKK